MPRHDDKVIGAANHPGIGPRSRTGAFIHLFPVRAGFTIPERLATPALVLRGGNRFTYVTAHESCKCCVIFYGCATLAKPVVNSSESVHSNEEL